MRIRILDRSREKKNDSKSQLFPIKIKMLKLLKMLCIIGSCNTHLKCFFCGGGEESFLFFSFYHHILNLNKNSTIFSTIFPFISK